MLKLVTALFISFNFLLITGAKSSDYIGGDVSYDTPWRKIRKGDPQSIRFLLDKITETKSGRKLVFHAIEKARKLGGDLGEYIKSGDASFTDTVLTRKFQANDPESISYDASSVVYLHRDRNYLDALLDLTHELTHFTYKEPFNPYVDSFNLGSFIKSTIEDKGGEAHAFYMECSVLKELGTSIFLKRKLCLEIIDKDKSKLSLSMAVEKFYKVGSHYNSLIRKLKSYEVTQGVHLLNDKKALFISSLYRLPYPVAVLREYEGIIEKVCENDKKRIALLKTNSRTPASIENYKETEKKYLDKCKFVI